MKKIFLITALLVGFGFAVSTQAIQPVPNLASPKVYKNLKPEAQAQIIRSLIKVLEEQGVSPSEINSIIDTSLSNSESVNVDSFNDCPTDEVCCEGGGGGGCDRCSTNGGKC